MHVKLGGKRYKLRFADLSHTEKVGDVDSPEEPGKEIRIHKGLSGERQLEIIIHECMHVFDWKKDEEFIDSEAKELSRILWRLGYRKTE